MRRYVVKKHAENILTVILLILVIPCALTLLLSGRMEKIYRAIKNETDYITVKTSSGTLELDLEEYVVGVTAAQIPFGYDIEAIKAQMVIARTNLYRQLAEGGESKEQNFVTMTELERAGASEKFLRAQKETSGEILTWEDEPIMASFHAVSTGKTRDGNDTFLQKTYPYLVSKICPADETMPNARQTIQIDDSWADLKVLERDSAGYVLRIETEDGVMSGEAFRILLGLPSSAFEVVKNENGVFLEVSGIGHGLGMSQYTAQQLALANKDYIDILSYFFEGVQFIQK